MSAVAYKDPDLFEIRFLPSGYLSNQSRDIIRKELIDANGGKRNRHNTITGSSNYQSDGHAKITSLIGMPHIVMSVLSSSSHEKNRVSNSIELNQLNTQLDMIMAAGASGVVQQMETIRQMVANIDVAPTTSQPAIDVSKNIENPPLPSLEKKSQAVLDSLDVKPVDSAPQPKQQEADQVLKPIVSEVKNPSPTTAPQNSDAEVSSSPSNRQEIKPEVLKSNDAKVSTNQPDVLEIKSNVSPIEVAASQPSSTQVDKAIETAGINITAQSKQQVTTRPENLNTNVLDARVTKVDVSTQKSDMGQKFSEPVKSSVAPVNKSTVSQPALQQPSQSNFATALKAAAVIPITPLAQTQFYQTRSTVVVQSQIPQTSTPQMKGVTSPATPYIQPQVTTSVASVVNQAQKPKVETVKTSVISQSYVDPTVTPKTAVQQPPKIIPEVKTQPPLEFKKLDIVVDVKPQQLDEKQPVFKPQEPVRDRGPEFKKPDPIIIKPVEVKPIEPTVQPRLELKDFLPKVEGGCPIDCNGKKGCCVKGFDEVTQAKTKEASRKSAAKINAVPPTNFVP